MAGKALRNVGVGLLLFVAGIFLLVTLVLEPPKQKMDAANRFSADQIVAALGAYQKANDQYPPELSRLAPRYLVKIPQAQSMSGTPRDFGYEMQDSGKVFVLTYDEAPLGPFPSDGAFEYDSRAHLWKTKYY